MFENTIRTIAQTQVSWRDKTAYRTMTAAQGVLYAYHTARIDGGYCVALKSMSEAQTRALLATIAETCATQYDVVQWLFAHRNEYVQ